MKMNEGVMFNVGDVVYYPGHGVCTVKTVFDSSRGVTEGPVFVLKPHKPFFSLQRLVLSFEKAKSLGVHRIVEEEQVPKIWNVLEQSSKSVKEDRIGGYQRVKEKLCSGNLVEVAKAARDLKNTRDFFAFSPRNRLLNKAKTMLSEEISFIEKKPENEIKHLIEEKLSNQQEEER